MPHPVLLVSGAYVLMCCGWVDALPADSQEPAPHHPCRPSPCGPFSQCRADNGHAVCTCMLPALGSPPTCNGCWLNEHCPFTERCDRLNRLCEDPCADIDVCGDNARCYSAFHGHNCECLPGFGADPSPYVHCKDLTPVKCPTLVNPSLEVECQHNNQWVNCDQPMVPGTRALVKCNAFYFPNEKASHEFETICNSNGTWSRQVHSCIPRCGEFNSPDTGIRGYHYWWYMKDKTYNKPTIDIPWHAGIYREIHRKFQHICGGSIISEHLVVTAAYCVWNITSGKPFDSKEFKIAVGKIYQDWYKHEENVQIPAIDQIIPHNSFRGAINWANDIALIKLKDSIQMNNVVRPICVDLKKNHETLFTPGNIGVVIGWGNEQANERSEKLRDVMLQYIDFEECLRGVPSTLLPFLTGDKYCAGNRNGSGVCAGDGGGGYASQLADGKWYLMGVLRGGIESLCYEYAIFTRVSLFYDFIRTYIS